MTPCRLAFPDGSKYHATFFFKVSAVQNTSKRRQPLTNHLPTTHQPPQNSDFSSQPHVSLNTWSILQFACSKLRYAFTVLLINGVLSDSVVIQTVIEAIRRHERSLCSASQSQAGPQAELISHANSVSTTVLNHFVSPTPYHKKGADTGWDQIMPEG
jgi:hypothetical protein